ncbi:DUF2004 domain-containing protein [Bacteroides faecium]|uniref:DUF2004 domain-containing protein n=1 Tax=Bacteroides faecium TaxID=2715212 RepID=A0A6H0KUH8_9BACE|nr:DUF2004 domain-containing protein [Bacteroides faecium]QIU96711.1 DUF2004 domain-containing protein [Bacteroides faecium]
MSKKKITYFGEVDNQEEDYFEGNVTLDNKSVELDLDFCSYEGKPVKWSEELEDYLSNLIKYKSVIDKAILDDYENGGTTNEYVQWHLDEWDAIDDLLPRTDSTKTKEEQFLSLLIQRVELIAFYPGDTSYAVWDYMIDSENSDEIVVVHTDSKGKILDITWES